MAKQEAITGQPTMPDRHSGEPARRPRSPRRKGPAPESRRGSRTVFFALTSMWGFLLGAGFLAGAARQAGQPVPWTVDVAGVLAPGAFLAVCSGLALSHLYRRWRERR